MAYTRVKIGDREIEARVHYHDDDHGYIEGPMVDMQLLFQEKPECMEFTLEGETVNFVSVKKWHPLEEMYEDHGIIHIDFTGRYELSGENQRTTF